ncbi:hypothetical protein CBS101457_005248 [Exobasidium rhododendri]|nr:hypothetical protein CBS101457_005248 [Exobasidium rhododendri]
MPVATEQIPASTSDLENSTTSLSASLPSLSSSLNQPQAKAFYNQAARNFLHRRHVEAIIYAERALSAFESEGLKDHSLAERLFILRITLLATVFRSSQGRSEGIPTTIFEEVKSGGKMTIEDQRAVDRLELLLSLPPTLFLTRLWVEILRFYVEILPRLPGIPSQVPSPSSETIVANSNNLAGVLQPPAGVVAAAIMGALRVDDESKTEDASGASSLKGKKEAKPAKIKREADLGPGLRAARSMCEWVMNAHSKMTGTYQTLEAQEVEHLYQQHHRVLQLYTIHILGTRLEQWEFAHEVTRCAVEIKGDDYGLQERQKLLDQLTSAQIHISTRGERRRLASENAKLRYKEEKSKRAASVEQQTTDHTAVGESKAHKDSSILSPTSTSDLAAVNTTQSAEQPPPSLHRRTSNMSNSSSTSASEMDSEGGIPTRRSSTKARESERKHSLGSDYAERRGHISGHLEKHHQKRSNSSGELSPTSEKAVERRQPKGRSLGRESGDLMQERVLVWIRSLGHNPARIVRYLSAVIAVLFIVRRSLQKTGKATTTLSTRRDLGGAGTTRSRLEQTRRQDESIVMTAVRKVWSTLRM